MNTPYEAAPFLRIENLSHEFPVHRSFVDRIIRREQKTAIKAVNNVSMRVQQGECYALVGESGSGKSTLAKIIAGLLRQSMGTVNFDTSEGGKTKPGDVMMIFQDPYASLNPRWRVKDVIGEPMIAINRRHRIQRSPLEDRRRIDELLELVGLAAGDAEKYPHEFSGGQRQRIGIARALSTRPRLLICDEPTSALDVSVQAQILNLLRELQEELELTYFYISHNMATVRFMASRVGVLYLGTLIEDRPAAEFFQQPLHPYARMLMSAVPDVDGEAALGQAIQGEIPSALDVPSGCPFHPRCDVSTAICAQEHPARISMAQSVGGGYVQCHHVSESRR